MDMIGRRWPHAVAICLAAATWTSVGFAMQLLSIKVQDLNADSYISGFQIKTWDIRLRAICKIPVGWMMTAGKELNPGGVISGFASGFMANIDMKQLEKLNDFILIDDAEARSPPAPGSPSEPPTFQASLLVGEYSKSPTQRDRRIRLKDLEIVLKPATQCPALTAD
jgi:hypothetical protein